MNIFPSNSDTDNSILEYPEDQNIILQRLNLFSIYETGDTKITGDHLIISEAIAKNTIDYIVNQGTDLLMEKYLLTKLNHHVINSLQNLMEMPLATEFIFFDNTSIDLEEDLEPVSF